MCWILIQGADIVLPAFGVPDWVFQALIYISIVGFPIIVILAWFFDVSEKGIAIDSDGHAYVAESVAGTIQIFDMGGTFLMEFGSGGGATATLRLPAGINIDGDRIYVANSGNSRIQVYQYLGSP